MKFKGALIGAGLTFLGVFFFSQPTVALSYQNTVGLEFTFDPLLNISLSSDALLIDGLAPGNSASSNTITITVNTTGLTGYTLSAAVGNGTTYTDNNLTNLASPASPKPTFTSIPTNAAAVASLTSDNTWAYTLDSTNYYGLAYIHSVNNNDETWTVLNATKDVSGTAATSGCVGTCAGTANTTFTISARAAATQPSGDYTNVIQFKVISNPVPSTYSITYNQNTTDTVTNMPTNVATTNTTDSTVTLSSNTPTRAGYTFGGWCTVQPTGNANCSGNTYAVGADMPITVGSTNTITLYAIWTVTALNSSVCPANSICYAPNTSDTEGDMSSLGTTSDLTTASPRAGTKTANSTTTLIAPNFYRPGYGFAGWSTEFDATTATNPVIYGPNETISTDPSNGGLDVSGGAVLYPVWVASTGTLQSFSCANSTLTTAPTNTRATLSSITALTDTRDDNVYAVAKLADGKCWMIENLRLDDSAILTIANTHNPLHSVNNNIVTLKTDYANGTIEDHLAASSSGTWCTGSSAACHDQTMLNTNNTRLSDSNLTAGYNTNNNSSKWYGYGNYYNWYSATAGNGTYSKSSGNVDGDLCPNGWHLPYGGSDTGTGGGNTAGGFYYLNTQMSNDTSTQGSKDWRAYPNNFVYSGLWNGAQAYSRNSNGRYWSSSAYDNHYAYYLFLYISGVTPGTDYYNKYNGLSVRCVAD